MDTAPARHHAPLLAALTAGVCVPDQLTKAWVRANLDLGERRPLLAGLVDLVHTENRGMAWGLLEGHPLRLPVVTVVSLLTLVVVLGWFVRLRADERVLAWSFALVVAGATGNFIDRLLYRRVTDFVEVLGGGVFGVFNVADIAITAGLLGFASLALRGRAIPPGLEVS